MSIKVGIGYDSHRFAAGRPLRLGGVTIPHTHGLVGHSDGDAVLHAVVDALLGAAALGDVGSRFPDTDPAWRGADSAIFLRATREALAGAGLAPLHVDVTVVIERPKLAPHLSAMRAAVAGALGVGEGAVSIKAKTNEGMGWIGAGEGVLAMAIATVREVGAG